jgi:cytochrome c1
MLGGCHAAGISVPGGDPRTGAENIARQACGSCHRIPGIALADGEGGPPLDGIDTRSVLAGTIPNSTDGMIRWLRDPQEAQPGNAMPDTGLTEQEARDVAAFLYTLR